MIKPLSLQEYTEFFYQQDVQSILQAPERVAFYEARHNDYDILGYFNQDNTLVFSAIIQYLKLSLGFNRAVLIYGPTGDLSNLSEFETFISELKIYLKTKKKTLSLGIIPYLPDEVHTLDLQPTKTNLGKPIIDILERQEFEYQGDDIIGLTNRWIMIKDLREFKNHQDILQSYHKPTRPRVNKLEEFHLEVEELTSDNLQRFVDIEKHTEETRGFQARDTTFYQHLFNAFNNQNRAKVTVARFNLQRYINELKEKLEQVTEELEALLAQERTPHVQKKINVATVQQNSFSSRLNRMTKLREKYPQEMIDIAARFYLKTNFEQIALFGGSLKDFEFIPASTFLYHHIILDTFDQNIPIYNYYGIYGYGDTGGQDSAILRFKKGFGGDVYKMVGEYDCVLQPSKLKLYQTIKNLAKVASRRTD